MRRAQRIRFNAIVLLALAAVAIACGTLYAIITPWDSPAWMIIPVALAALGAVIMIGCALSDIRYARMLEQTGRR